MNTATTRMPHPVQYSVGSAFLWVAALVLKVCASALLFVSVYFFAQTIETQNPNQWFMLAAVVGAIGLQMARKTILDTLDIQVPGGLRVYRENESHLAPTLVPAVVQAVVMTALWCAGTWWTMDKISSEYGAWATIFFVGAASTFHIVSGIVFLIRNRAIRSNFLIEGIYIAGYGAALAYLFSWYKQTWNGVVLGVAIAAAMVLFAQHAFRELKTSSVWETLDEVSIGVVSWMKPAVSLQDREKAKRIGRVTATILVCLILIAFFALVNFLNQ